MKKNSESVGNLVEGRSELYIGLALAVPILILYLYAFLFGIDIRGTWIVGTLTTIMVFFVGAISLDLEVGSMGLPNFGKVGFFAIGAYTSTLLYSEWGVPFPIAVLLALLLSAVVGYFISIPTVKLRADYFAIMTIAGGEIIRLMLAYEKRWLWVLSPAGTNTQVITNKFKIQFTGFFDQVIDLTPFNGVTILIIRIIIIPIELFDSLLGSNLIPAGWKVTDFTWGNVFLWEILLVGVFLLISLLTYWLVQQIRKSPYGRTIRAIREDDITVTSVGKDVARFRWQITTVAALLAGLAGVMYATTFGAFEAAEFRPALTFQLYMFIIIGGLGNSKGAFAGTALVTMFLRAGQVDAVKENFSFYFGPDTPLLGPILEFLQLDVFINPFNLRFVILGIILVLFLLFKPAGLIREPKTDNEKYLKLLTTEEREDSDLAVSRRQSLTERERIDEEDKAPAKEGA